MKTTPPAPQLAATDGQVQHVATRDGNSLFVLGRRYAESRGRGSQAEQSWRRAAGDRDGSSLYALGRRHSESRFLRRAAEDLRELEALNLAPFASRPDSDPDPDPGMMWDKQAVGYNMSRRVRTSV